MNLKQHRFKLLVGLMFLVALAAFSQVRLPKLLSDGMVLQRNTDIKIWGWAAPNEQVTVQFLKSTHYTSADSNGEWNVLLTRLAAGGPYTMQIIASNTITISDVMVGDVWLCSGQSNMELPMRRVSPIYQHEIASSENNAIRYFAVPQKYNFCIPQTDLEFGSWKKTNPENVLSFSAVAYFFAQELYETYHVPIGLINASLGGSPAESWISEDALQKFPLLNEELQKFKDSSAIRQIEESDNQRIHAWYDLSGKKDAGYKAGSKSWKDPKFNSSKWPVMKIPGYWLSTKLGPVNGVVWFRKDIRIPSSWTGQPAKLNLGRIVDADSVFVNGVCVGSTGYQYPPRRYEIPARILKNGKNSLVVRVISNIGNGGFVPDKPYELIVKGKTKDLKGDWRYQLGAEMEPLAGQTFVRWKPTGLYNAMIHPLLNYTIKGAVWYQGESNAGRPIEYRELFPALIRNWRDKWNQGDFPFLFVQLPNFMEPTLQPSESNWALLREAQLKSLSSPKTGMAVAIDLGEWNDIHPLNKKDVGRRLALAAEKVAYDDARIVFSGPIYESMKINGNNIELTFSNVGTGLVTKGKDELKYFSIAGADKKFIWAKAKLGFNKVVVWNDTLMNPVAVRYAWADNPEGANLYNKEGLPASPFRTDEW
ncbi:MAG: sialate O-acetylesterase [Ignavibacteriae bacterium]|nr:MAG: sialate O-acetylesterase [Ignavibacteriota bacterium]